MAASLKTAVRFLCYIGLMLTYFTIYAQNKTANTYIYNSYGYGDTSRHFVLSQNGQQKLWSEDRNAGKRTIPGFAKETTYIDSDSIFYLMDFGNGDRYFTYWTHSSQQIEWDSVRVDATTMRYITSINSNRLEFEMSSRYGEDINPLTHYGKLPGVLVLYRRNGQVGLELSKVEKQKLKGKVINETLIPKEKGQPVSGRELNNIKQQKMILTTRVFDKAQIHWGAETKHEKAVWNQVDLTQAGYHLPFDTVIHFAGGTVVLKRMKMDTIPSHYQIFAELHQQSNGDAYDRTGSIFVIPHEKIHSFFEGMAKDPDALPIFNGRDGEKYQGILATENYQPAVELIRFFTPFGVHHFNDRLKLDGLEWEDEAYYKQEITDVALLLQGDVWIGAFIGNYDGGGHLVTLDLKAYPSSELWETNGQQTAKVVPLFNTCNILEMAGQNYGKLFRKDSVTIHFNVPEGAKRIRLRYISTGHGGWDGGDEFNPKENEIFIDGQLRFTHTPWRCDCGRYREWNPVSGNFWNGTSSSDYSRSGWCPGTATQPVYFNLSNLTPGEHTITVAIPLGEPEGGSFSHWNISGALIIE